MESFIFCIVNKQEFWKQLFQIILFWDILPSKFLEKEEIFLCFIFVL